MAAATLIVAYQRNSRMVYRLCSRKSIGRSRWVPVARAADEGKLWRRHMAAGTGRRSPTQISRLDVVAELACRQYIAGRKMGTANSGEVRLEGPSITAIRMGNSRTMASFAPLGQIAQRDIEARVATGTSSSCVAGLAIDQVVLGNRTVQDRIGER